MATVYSYIRFSSKKQEEGDSVNRQLAMGKAWLARNPQHTLDTSVTLRDLGISGFRGKNLDPEKGDLGKFLALVKQEDSPIAPGSILMIESLDRFSRLQPTKVSPIFYDLVESGIDVVTLNPEQYISADNINNPSVLLPVNMYMSIAHEQSKEKRFRVGGAWRTKRKQATENGTPMSKRCPAWLQCESIANGFTIKPEGLKALTYIFERTADDCGEVRLCKELSSGDFPPLGTSGAWNTSYISKILNDRSVLGECQLYRFTDKGQRVPDGKPVAGYYPRVISDELFYKANGAKAKRIKQKGKHSQFVNLFAGMVRGTDGPGVDGKPYPRHINTSRTKRKGKDVADYVQRRFYSYGHLRKQDNACPLSYDYWKFEYIVLMMLGRYRLNAQATGKKSGESSLSVKQFELGEIHSRLDGLNEQIANLRGKLPSGIVSAMADLEQRKETLTREIENIRQEQSTPMDESANEVRDLLDEYFPDDDEITISQGQIATTTERTTDEQNKLRLKLRSLIPNIIDSITLDLTLAPRRKVWAQITVNFKDGYSRSAVQTDSDVVTVEDSRDKYPEWIAVDKWAKKYAFTIPRMLHGPSFPAK